MSADGLFPYLPPARDPAPNPCHRSPTAPIPVRWIESNSGPGTTLYACSGCAPTRGVGPRPNTHGTGTAAEQASHTPLISA